MQIRVWHSQGICSIRLRGTEKMGTITVGNWPADAEGVSLSADNKMLINGTFHPPPILTHVDKKKLGPGGERIIRIDVAFQLLNSEEKVVGLRITTSDGREKAFLAPLAALNASFDHAESARSLLCPEGDEIVGLHGIFGIYAIHDMGLVVRERTERTGFPCHVNGRGVVEEV